MRINPDWVKRVRDDKVSSWTVSGVFFAGCFIFTFWNLVGFDVRLFSLFGSDGSNLSYNGLSRCANPGTQHRDSRI